MSLPPIAENPIDHIEKMYEAVGVVIPEYREKILEVALFLLEGFLMKNEEKNIFVFHNIRGPEKILILMKQILGFESEELSRGNESYPFLFTLAFYLKHKALKRGLSLSVIPCYLDIKSKVEYDLMISDKQGKITNVEVTLNRAIEYSYIERKMYNFFSLDKPYKYIIISPKGTKFIDSGLRNHITRKNALQNIYKRSLTYSFFHISISNKMLNVENTSQDEMLNKLKRLFKNISKTVLE